MSPTSSSTTTTSSTTTASTSISFLNILNVLAYVANAAVVFSVGVFGILGQGNNAELSAKYQTLVTPAPWAFGIWSVIYLVQLVWTVLQLFVPTYRAMAKQHVQYNYVCVCLAQIGWSIAFGLQIIWLSMICMALILHFLLRIVFHQQRQRKSFPTAHPASSFYLDYALMQFPFTLHAGWIIAATVVNANVVLVAYHATIAWQFVAAVVSLVLVLIAASYFLASPDFVIPAVLLWALSAVFVELSNPQDPIRAKIDARNLNILRAACGLSLVAIAVSFLIRLYTACTAEFSLSPRSAAAAARHSSSLQEPLTPSNNNNN